MHPLMNTLVEIHHKLEEIGKMLEELAQQYSDNVKENAELKHKMFWSQDSDDGRC